MGRADAGDTPIYLCAEELRHHSYSKEFGKDTATQTVCQWL